MTGPSGWVFVGPKRSGLKVTDEDRELLQALAAEMSGPRPPAVRPASRKRSSTNGLAREAGGDQPHEDEFISSVSYDEPRTPMTSLQAISGLLDSGKGRRDVAAQASHRADGRRVQPARPIPPQRPRFRRIEQDVITYEIRETDLAGRRGVVEVVRSAAAEDDLDSRSRRPRTRHGRRDPDAVRQASQPGRQRHQVQPGRKHIAVRLVATAAGGAEISVSDRGFGISAEDRERIFEAFYRAPEAVRHDPKGVGLGLKIVTHHGRPRRRDRDRRIAGARNDVHPEIRGKAVTMKQILIIDDDRVPRQTLAAALETEGYGCLRRLTGGRG